MNTEQQPHLEILSHNKVNRSTIIIGVIPVTAVTVIFVAAVWPFLSWIAYGSLGLLVLAALYLAGRAYIDLRQRWYHAAIVHASEHGIINMATWQHLPALPEPSVTVTEEPGEPTLDLVAQSADVIDLHRQGTGYEAISKLYKGVGIEYWTPWKVRKLCEEYEKKHETPPKTREKVTKKREE